MAQVKKAAKLLDETTIPFSPELITTAWRGHFPVFSDQAEGFEGAPMPLMEEALPAVAMMVARYEDQPEKVTQFISYLILLSTGVKTKQVMTELNLTWPQLRSLGSLYPETRAAIAAAKVLGEEFRMALRLDAAHERAVEGVEENVYSPSGKLVGTRRYYSDRLLEMLLKADAPEKFMPKQQVELQGGFTVIFETGFDRDRLREEEADAEVVDWEPVA
jgi:hypothetical protein